MAALLKKVSSERLVYFFKLDTYIVEKVKHLFLDFEQKEIVIFKV